MHALADLHKSQPQTQKPSSKPVSKTHKYVRFSTPKLNVGTLEKALQEM